METSLMDETDVDFNLSLEDEFQSIDRLIAQANEFLFEFSTSQVNSTISIDNTLEESIREEISASDTTVNLSETLHEDTQTPTPQSGSRPRSEQNDDADVICIGVTNPTIVDYIDLCSPSPLHSSEQRGPKRNSKVRRYPDIVCNTVKDQQECNVEEPENKRAKDLTCRICFESLFDRVTMSTACGHMFCKTCLDQVLKIQKKCPLCKHPLNRNRVFRIYL